MSSVFFFFHISYFVKSTYTSIRNFQNPNDVFNINDRGDPKNL